MSTTSQLRPLSAFGCSSNFCPRGANRRVSADQTDVQLGLVIGRAWTKRRRRRRRGHRASDESGSSRKLAKPANGSAGFAPAGLAAGGGGLGLLSAGAVGAAFGSAAATFGSAGAAGIGLDSATDAAVGSGSLLASLAAAVAVFVVAATASLAGAASFAGFASTTAGTVRIGFLRDRWFAPGAMAATGVVRLSFWLGHAALPQWSRPR